MTKNIFSLFINFLQIGSFSIGGGYAIIPLIEQQVVFNNNWLNPQEFTDIITISQMTPGPLAINTASFVGIRISGILGAIFATLGSIIPGFIISIFLYNFFKKHKNIDSISNMLKGLHSSSIGLISSFAISIVFSSFVVNSKINIIPILSFLFSIFLLRKYKTNPIIIMLLTGVFGLLFY